MRKRICKTVIVAVTVLFAAASATSPLFAQTTSPDANPTAPAKTDKATTAQPAQLATIQTAETKSAQPSAEEMKKMMEQMMVLGQPGENHKLLAEMAGNWNYTMKMMMDPATGKPGESKGTAIRKAIFDGRYFTFDVSGKFQMPGKDGKMTDMNFKGSAIEGYDNGKKKFISSWIDNMSTMMMVSEGTYDAASKTFTFMADCEMPPGTRVKMREVIKIVDKDHHNFEMYEDRGQGETKTMEIAYTRSGKK